MGMELPANPHTSQTVKQRRKWVRVSHIPSTARHGTQIRAEKKGSVIFIMRDLCVTVRDHIGLKWQEVGNTGLQFIMRKYRRARVLAVIFSARQHRPSTGPCTEAGLFLRTMALFGSIGQEWHISQAVALLRASTQRLQWAQPPLTFSHPNRYPPTPHRHMLPGPVQPYVSVPTEGLGTSYVHAAGIHIPHFLGCYCTRMCLKWGWSRCEHHTLVHRQLPFSGTLMEQVADCGSKSSFLASTITRCSTSQAGNEKFVNE